MLTRYRYILHLERFGVEIFYAWDYDPPIRNCGGGWGGVLPGGSMYSVSYDELLALGNGTHLLKFDERQPSKKGSAVIQTEDDKLFRNLRFELFLAHVDIDSGQLLTAVLMSLTPRNCDRVLPLLANCEDTLEFLRAYAKSIAASPVDREKQDHFCNTVTDPWRIPDENLEVIRCQFGSSERECIAS